jgi:hypothetical protein
MCKYKKEFDIQEKITTVQMENMKLKGILDAENNKRTNALAKENLLLREKLDAIEQEYMDYLKSVKQGTNLTVKGNMYYVINNFTSAYNFDDLMDKDLTEEEIEYIKQNGATAGSLKLLTNRCITGIKLHQRPFHCVDEARDKYILRENDDWKVDKRASAILKRSYSKVEEAYPMIGGAHFSDSDDSDIEIDSEDIDENTNNMQELIQMRVHGYRKILNELNRITLLKNNINI